MPVYLNSISFKNELSGTDVNWLLANVGDRIVIEHDISIYTSEIDSTQNEWIINNDDGYIGGGWVTGGDFTKFKVGDQIKWYDYVNNTASGNFVILQIPDNTSMQVAPIDSPYSPTSPGPPGFPFLSGGTNVPGDNDVISLINPITALNYKWNFIENGDAVNYFSKIDGTEQLAYITGLNPAGGGTNKPMTFFGPLPYQIGAVTVDEVALLNGPTDPIYTSKFKIKHSTRITPFILAQQWDDLLSGIAPDYFLNLNCLKSVFYYEARYNLTDPNNIETLEKEDILGNSGWFDESWNTGLTKYFLSNLSYISGSSVPGVKLNLGTTTFSFKLKTNVAGTFSNGNTKLVLNFGKAPNEDSEYTLNNRDVIHNFVWETALLTASSTPTPVNGDNFGDPTLQSLNNLTATYVSGTEIDVAGDITLLQDAIDVFNESNEPRYMFWVSIQNHALPGAVGDRTSLLIDAQAFYFQTTIPGFVTFRQLLIPHQINNYTGVVTLNNRFVEDEIVAYNDLTIQTALNVDNFPYFITRVTGKIKAFNNITGDEFILDQQTINTSGFPYIGTFQYFNIQQNQVFHVPSTEIRKTLKLFYDTANNKYVFAYPFLERWEYWLSQQSVDASFFDVTAPNNGFNKDWQHYLEPTITSPWRLAFVVEVGMKINNIPAVYSSQVNFRSFQRNLPGEAISLSIDTYDPTSLSPLIDGAGNKYILGYQNTLVTATFTKTSALSVADVVVVIGLEIFEEGGVAGKRRMSSLWPSDSDTWFLPLSGPNTVQLAFSAGNTVCKASALIDFTKLDISKRKWKLSARLYETKITPM